MSETEGSMRLWLVGLVLLVGHALGGAEEGHRGHVSTFNKLIASEDGL